MTIFSAETERLSFWCQICPVSTYSTVIYISD